MFGLVFEFILLFLLNLILGDVDNTTSIIFVAPPTENNSYYFSKQTELYDYYAELINVVNTEPTNENEYILALVDEFGKNELLNRGIDEKNIFVNEISEQLEDIWCRDFGTVQVDNTLYKFKYQPNYLNQSDAESTDNAFIHWLDYNEVDYTNIDIILDAGNFVFERNTKKMITTTRILDDNPTYTKTEMINYLKTELNINEIAIIEQEENEATGHSDGMVTFINENVIGINDFDKYSTLQDFYNDIVDELIDAFDDGQGSLNIIDLPYAPTDDTFGVFASSKGIYTNILTGLYTQYSPTYSSTNGDDELNIEELEEWSAENVNVKGVDATDVSIMGGAVRCL